MEWIDTHCHLDEESFTQDCHDTIQRAVDAGVTRMLAIEWAEKLPQPPSHAIRVSLEHTGEVERTITIETQH